MVAVLLMPIPIVVSTVAAVAIVTPLSSGGQRVRGVVGRHLLRQLHSFLHSSERYVGSRCQLLGKHPVSSITHPIHRHLLEDPVVDLEI